ncbi:MAG: ABC transporter permease [Bacteroidota bacterium]
MATDSTQIKSVIKFFRWFCNPDYAEDIEGDLMERFEKNKTISGDFRANMKLTTDVFRLFRPGIIRPLKGTQKLNSIDMLKHNILITFRNFRRYKGNFLINLIGLSTGLASVLFIYLWVSDELATDSYHQNSENLYQIRTNHKNSTGIKTGRGVPGLLLDEIENDLPEIKMAIATTDVHEYTLSTEDDSYKANGRFASEEYFNLFSFSSLKGNLKTALSDKANIVISASLAKRIFNSTDVIGKSLDWHFWNNSKSVIVSAVMNDIPSNSSEKFDFVMSWDYYHDDMITFKGWGNYYGRIMVQLHPDADVSATNEKIDQILIDKQGSDTVDTFLAKYGDQYLYNKYTNGVQAGGRIEYVWLFSIVAFFILGIACINFINLSTAKASHKTKEIGVKKTMGASRLALMGQYFTESVLLGFISLLVATALVWLLLPYFNIVTDKQITFQLDGLFILVAISIIFAVGILAGLYPALYLSGLKITESLKSGVLKGSGRAVGRKALVVFQFSISIILIVATWLIQEQMEFVQQKNLGYDRENVIYFEREGTLLEKSEEFLAELKSIPTIETASTSGFMIGGANSTGGIEWTGKGDDERIEFWETRLGANAIETLNIEMVAGRSFSNEFATESESIIFNEAAIKAMGISDPIGKTVKHYSGSKQIVGVVKDFNMLSLHTEIQPSFFLYRPDFTHFVMIKLQKGAEIATLRQIETVYESFNPDFPFKPKFLDQDYQALYASENKIADLSGYFSILAILISCLGLFGLSTFTIEKRQKEIGIRKVLGSGVLNIVYLLSRDFTAMVLIAIVIALPVSYYLGRSWLENFAYNITLGWSFFFLAGFGALVISWLTVGLQTINAALANPVDSLKDE